MYLRDGGCGGVTREDLFVHYILKHNYQFYETSTQH
jgi:hypothetical protein